jgi:3-polyprenyl-4-hydroxybenzoate decarboxylase
MAAAAGIDFERFRLRRFVEHLIEIGEVEVHAEPVALADISGIIEASPKATLFKNAGPEHFEIVGAVGGSRRRYAEAFGHRDERTLAQEFGLVGLFGAHVLQPLQVVKLTNSYDLSINTFTGGINYRL